MYLFLYKFSDKIITEYILSRIGLTFFSFWMKWIWVHYYWDHYWPAVPAQDDDGRWWVRTGQWNNWQWKQTYSEKTCPSAPSSTTNLVWPDWGSHPGHSCGKSATNRLSYGTANRPKLTSNRHAIQLNVWFSLDLIQYGDSTSVVVSIGSNEFGKWIWKEMAIAYLEVLIQKFFRATVRITGNKS
jgi:hypothetical protein